MRMEIRIQFACPPGGGQLPSAPTGRAAPLAVHGLCVCVCRGVCFGGFLSSHWPLSAPVLSSLGLGCELDNKSDIGKASLPPAPHVFFKKMFWLILALLVLV